MSSNQTTSAVTGNRFIRRKEAAARLGISIATLDRWAAIGRVCKPSHIGPRASGWPESYLDALIAGAGPKTEESTSQSN